MAKEHIFSVRVYYEDTDAVGVVYHANYLHFMERARTEWHLQLMADVQSIFAVYKAELDFLRPAKLYDQLSVVTTITKLVSPRITFKQVVCLADDPKIVFCQGLITVVHINNNMRPVKMPRVLVEMITNDI